MRGRMDEGNELRQVSCFLHEVRSPDNRNQGSVSNQSAWPTSKERVHSWQKNLFLRQPPFSCYSAQSSSELLIQSLLASSAGSFRYLSLECTPRF